MNTTISNNGMPKLPQAPSGQGASTQNAAGSGASEAGSASAGADDRVQLTDSARALQEASRTNAGATVDTRKVDQIRQALANGSYRIDPSRIADRMMSLEKQINGKS
ncbi:flagellar biosynthesis anti-sigma factor FlgM [Dyella soli]|uniref:Negative regulator of flagellin synthesis n=1 Tax=Dyella soli TaxID=522319 RepID=A0A4R0YPV1_9GAMM|nr:flagellar biosynthesis anti-sigma factor FlgM [Dyella soli]TCI06811.1 flagellar biosynthesis anti-sigma factor FlgM [Dyella soli]